MFCGAIQGVGLCCPTYSKVPVNSLSILCITFPVPNISTKNRINSCFSWVDIESCPDIVHTLLSTARYGGNHPVHRLLITFQRAPVTGILVVYTLCITLRVIRLQRTIETPSNLPANTQKSGICHFFKRIKSWVDTVHNYPLANAAAFAIMGFQRAVTTLWQGSGGSAPTSYLNPAALSYPLRPIAGAHRRGGRNSQSCPRR